MYLLDANIFIEPFKRNWYGFENHPAYWELLDDLFASGEARSTLGVHEELKPRGDELWDWAVTRKAYFPELNSGAVSSFSKLSRDIYSKELVDYFGRDKVEEFADGADLELIAEALSNSAVVVTKERPVTDRSKITIPFICDKYGVRVINLPDFLKEINVSFDSYSRT